MGGGNSTNYFPAQIPGFQRSIGNQYAEFLGRMGRGVPASPFNLGFESPTSTNAFAQARQFGATGMQPFMDTLSSMAQTGGTQGGEQALYDVYSRDFGKRAADLRAQAGTTGLSSSSSLTNALAGTQKDLGVDLARQLVDLREAGANRRLQASQLGMTLMPSALTQLANLGQMEYAPIERQYNDWVLRNITAPIQAFGGSGSVMNMNSQQPSYGVSQNADYMSPLASIIGSILMYSALA